VSSDDASAAAPVDRALINFVATITIATPRLVERLDDLPILAQCFLETCNRESGKQVGSLRTDTLDELALHSWPGELDELSDVIAAAHAACDSHEVTPSHLPAVIHHAVQAASRPRKRTERIVLDDLLAQIEREAIVRALAQADGNKTEAADLLGMTRPRLYRRLVQLGLVSESKEPEPQLPEFIEQPNDEEPQ
jgi:DNA-binding NtrC family response regulator